MDKFNKKRNKKLKGFFSNFASWLIMSTFFIILNSLTYSGHWWAIWPILGWGIGVAFHAMSIFKYLLFNQLDKPSQEQSYGNNQQQLPESDWQPINENRKKEKMPNTFDESEFV